LGWVEEARVRWAGLTLRVALPVWDVRALPVGPWPQVEIVLNHAGATGAVVQALLQAGVRGLVAAGTGNGALSQPLTQALHQAMAEGVQVVRSTRCPLGQVIPVPDATIPLAAGLSPVKARVALQLSLMGLPPAN
jgi:L-asparaginase